MATLEDLKKTWQSQCGISQERFDQIGSKVRGTSDLLHATIYRRDLCETMASALVAVLFFPGLFIANNWVARSGFAIEVIAGCTIPFVLWWARKRSPVTISATNFLDFINIEIDFLRRQVQLLRMVTWWYLLPIYIGIVLIMAGFTGPDFSPFDLNFLTVYLIFCTVFFVYIWWLNRSARKAKLEPLLRYYEEMRIALENGGEFALQLPDSASAFLQSKSRKPITKRGRWTWIILTVAVTALVAAAGYATMQYFDARTGKFFVSIAPVISLLMIFVSGVWRRNPVGVPIGDEKSCNRDDSLVSNIHQIEHEPSKISMSQDIKPSRPPSA